MYIPTIDEIFPVEISYRPLQKRTDETIEDLEDAVLSAICELEKQKGDILVLGWGGTHGAIRSAVESMQNEGMSVSHLHLRYLNPLPKDLGEILVKFQKVIIPELNMGQLAMIIRSKYLIDTISLNKVAGKPFTRTEIYNKIQYTLKEMN